MEAGSAINTPHPDDAANEAEAFFGGAEPEFGGEPEPEPAKPADGHTLTAEQREADARQYREERGEPHPQPGDPDEIKAIAESRNASRPADDPTPQAESGGPTEDPTPTGDGGTTGSTGEQAAPASDEAGQQQSSGKQSGSLEREYRVFQKLPLTKRVLEHLLKQLEESGGEPRVALFEVGRTEQRNVKAALAHIYKGHRQRLGDECDLAAVSTKALQERKVRPRQRPVEEDIEIS